MQFLGPAEKGTNANGLRPWLFSGRKRAGLNSSGAGHTSGFLWSPMVETPTAVPFGTKYPPGTTKTKEIKNHNHDHKLKNQLIIRKPPRIIKRRKIHD